MSDTGDERPTPLRILLIADDPLARSGLLAAIGSGSPAQVVGQATTADDLGALREQVRAELILCDLGWGGLRDSTALDGLAASDVPVVALVPDIDAAAEAWSAGIRSILLRDIDPGTLMRTLLAAGEGLIVLDGSLSRLLSATDPPDAPGEGESLTAREVEVLKLMAEGLPNKGIAARLGVSENTAKFHVNAILRKLHAQSRTEAVVLATRRGLILL